MISVIIPFYNTNKKLFEKCINSIIEQNTSNYEIIIVDDGSKEEFYDFLENYIKYDNIKVFHTENKGVSSARNYGIKKSTGKYIMFVDSDDVVVHNSFKNLNDCLKYDADIYIGKTLIKNINSENESYSYLKSNCFIDSSKLIESIFNDKNEFFSYVDTPWAKLYRKQFLINNNLSFNINLRLGEDALFNYECYEKTDKIYFCNSVLYEYVSNLESVTKKYNSNIIKDFSKTLNEFNKKINFNKFCNQFNEYKLKQLDSIYKRYLFNDNGIDKFETKKNETKKFIEEYYNDTLQFSNIRKIKSNKRKIIAILTKFNFYKTLSLLYKLKG